MNAVDSWHFNKAQKNRKTKIHEQSSIFSKLKRKLIRSWKKYNSELEIIFLSIPNGFLTTKPY